MKNFKSNKLGIILSIILMIITVITVGIILYINVLPVKYLIALIIILLGFAAFVSVYQFKRRQKSKKLNVITGIGILMISILLIYFVNTFNFLNLVTRSGYKIQNYSVIVLKDSRYEKIQDISGEKLGYLENGDEGSKLALENITKEVTTTQIAKSDVISLSDDLFSNDLQAIMIENSYKEILNEEIENFSNNTKVIYEFSVKIKVDENSKGVGSITEEPFNVYISGIDTYGDISSVSRSDVNIVVTVNPNTHQVLLTNIPRDYYVTIPGTSGNKDKLTHAGIYGIDKSIGAVEDILDININYYVKVNFTSLEEIVDALGGIIVYSEYSFTSYIDNYYFQEGYNNMNGSQALAFSRERKSFAEGDIMRGRNQQAVIEAIIRKASSPSIIYKYNSLLNSLNGKFQTNMTSDEILELIKFQLNKNPTWNVTSITLNGVGSSEYTYTAGNQRLSVLIPDESTISNAKSLIKAVFDGKVLESSYGEVTSPSNPIKNIVTESNTNEKEEVKKEEKVENDVVNSVLQNEVIENNTVDNNITNEIINDVINDIDNNETIDNTVIDNDISNDVENEIENVGNSITNQV
ncbi:MAG: LCP family protein [Clostridia bacterium]|nr:LCP family protein [Clostridia bacterium]